jgi:hypothetical protein
MERLQFGRRSESTSRIERGERDVFMELHDRADRDFRRLGFAAKIVERRRQSLAVQRRSSTIARRARMLTASDHEAQGVGANDER